MCALRAATIQCAGASTHANGSKITSAIAIERGTIVAIERRNGEHETAEKRDRRAVDSEQRRRGRTESAIQMIAYSDVMHALKSRHRTQQQQQQQHRQKESNSVSTESHAPSSSTVGAHCAECEAD